MFHRIEDTDIGAYWYRGKGGMLRLEDSAYPTDFVHTMLKGFKEAEFGDIGDFSGENPYCADIVQKYYINNVRHTPADAYLSEKIRKRHNLTIQTDTFVRKVIFDGNVAIGVEVEYQGKIQEIKANKEIILSAGTYNTAQLLKVSGIGPKKELQKYHIPLIADVPGVGEGLNDHLMFTMRFVSPIEIPNSIMEFSSKSSIAQWRKDRTGPACYYPGAAAGLVSSDGTHTGPDFELIFYYLHGANGSEREFSDISDLPKKSGYSIPVILMVPKSKGRVLLASDDPHDKPLIDPNYFGDPEDMKHFIKGVRYAMRIIKTEELSPYTGSMHPALDSTDEELENAIRNEASTVFHPVGTARIGDLEKDPMAVVDSHLRVRGVKGLRIADASVIPHVNRGHTMGPVVYVGEMAADIIRSEKT